MNMHAWKERVCSNVDTHKETYTQLADAIWDKPELNFHEDFAADALCTLLENEGFAAPKVTLDPSVTDFYAFTKNSFQMENYQFHPFDFEIPMAI